MEKLTAKMVRKWVVSFKIDELQAAQAYKHWKTSFEKNCLYAEYGFDQQRLI